MPKSFEEMKGKGIGSTEIARQMQKKSAAKKKENNIERKAIREMFEDKLRERGYADIDVWLSNLVERAKDNTKDMEFALAIIGEKPKEQIEIAQDKPFEVHIEVVE